MAQGDSWAFLWWVGVSGNSMELPLSKDVYIPKKNGKKEWVKVRKQPRPCKVSPESPQILRIGALAS